MRTKTFLFLCCYLFCSNSSFSQYLDFPYVGWTQTNTNVIWTGLQLDYSTYSFTFDRDTVINNIPYVVSGSTHIYGQDGRVISRIFNHGTQEYEHRTEFDFRLNVGDKFTNYWYSSQDDLTVIDKRRVVNLLGDSIWQLTLTVQDFITVDTIYWVEGVGDKNTGLFKSFAPDGYVLHACTHDSTGVRMFDNDENTLYCNCDYVYGIDRDQDSYGNHEPRGALIETGFHQSFPGNTKVYKVRQCDTLKLVSPDLDFIYMNTSPSPNSAFNIEFDEINEVSYGNFEFVLYEIPDVDVLYLSKNDEWDFGELHIEDCIETDCDDMNPEVNPGAVELVYNGIDDDCNGDTRDDDLDVDGYDLSDDCDDMNPEVNPGMIEIVYNGIDDDCNVDTRDDDLDVDGYDLSDDCDDMNPMVNPGMMELVYNGIDDDCNVDTQDDDLDVDGFYISDDCDDTNPDINPEAEEIPNNGIDEDCDGDDLLTSNGELYFTALNVYPNPVGDFLHIEGVDLNSIDVKIYNVTGEEMVTNRTLMSIDFSGFNPGTYTLLIQDVDKKFKTLRRVVKLRN